MLSCPNCGRESPDDFTFCPACGSPLTKTVQREVRKTITVVFCDVIGSTALAERLDPEALRRVMSRYFNEMRIAIERHGGTVEKFIGDAVMAVFGIPVLHEDDALRGVRSAADMRDALVPLNEVLERKYGVTLAARIGVNTGEVVAGDPAIGHAIVTGDAVNVAARLEQAALPGEILLGSETLRLVRNDVVSEPLVPLELKGKAEPVAAHRLKAVTGATGRMRRMDSPLVGRRRELAALRRAFDLAIDDQACRLFTIVAPAGVGKSRLVEEFLGGLTDATVLRGRCLPYGEGITYFPVLDVVKQAAGLADFDAPELVESKICAILQGEENQAVVCERIAQLMGVADAAAPEETFWAIRRMFEAIARRRALALVFDDVQWGEATFLDLVEHVAHQSRDAPILLLCMARPDLLDLRPTWGKPDAAIDSLEPLSDEETDELITNLLGSAQVAQELRGRIAKAAEGNPLFVEEMLAMLIDDGLLERDGGRIVATTELSTIVVPPTITALLGARLDALTSGERAVLERASVVGQEFLREAVRELAPESEPGTTDEHLNTLVRKGLVRPHRATPQGEDAFSFRHMLIRDAAYGAMPKMLRAELHERFATWLERIAGDRIAEQEEILGYHLERAYRFRCELGPVGESGVELASAASSRLQSAARRALGRGDAQAGLNLAERADALLPTDHPERSHTLRTLLSALDEAAAAPERRLRLDEEALDVARAIDDRALEHWVRAERASVLLTSMPQDADLSEALQTTTEAARVIESQGDAEDQARLLLRLASLQWAFGEMEDMLATSERALAFALETPGPDALTLITFVWVGMFEGATKASVALERLREIEGRCAAFPLRAAAARTQVALTLAILGRADEARATYNAARAVFDDVANPWVSLNSQAAEGLIELFAGNIEKTEPIFRQNVRGWMDHGNPTNAALLACRWAAALADLGRYQEALAVADEFIALAGSWDLEPRIELGAHRARALAGIGAVGEAVDAIAQIETMVRPTGFVFNLGDVMLAETEVFRTAGRIEDAARAAREALEIFERKEFAMYTDRARRLLAEVG
jgi:class 3 adenylate cyclase/tetratricopeptide (TPR) repeat protein